MGCSQSSPMDAEEPSVPVKQDESEVPAGGDHKFKIITIGAEGVGKSCLAQRAVDNTYTDSVYTTSGAGLSFVDIEVAGELGSATAKCQIVDTAGYERFRALSRIYVKDADAVLCCFDLSNRLTLDTLPRRIEDCLGFAPDAVIFLVGCKADILKADAEDSDLSDASDDLFDAEGNPLATTARGIHRARADVETKVYKCRIDNEVNDCPYPSSGKSLEIPLTDGSMEWTPWRVRYAETSAKGW